LLTSHLSVLAGAYALVACEALTQHKLGRAVCPVFGGLGGAIGYFVPELILPSWFRVRDVQGEGNVRGDGKTTSRLMSFGIGSTPRLEGGKPLRQRLSIVAQLLALAEKSGIPASVVSLFTARAGWDWEYDVQCVAESLQTQKCFVGTRLSTTCKAALARCKATAMVQVPVQLEPELIRAFLSDDFVTRSKALFQIAAGHAMDAPVRATLEAASVSLGVSEGPIAPLLPEGGAYFQRFELGLDLPFKHPGLDRWKARISTTPTVQVGKMLRSDGRQLLTVRSLDTGAAGWGFGAHKHQEGQQLLVEIGQEGEPANAAAVRSFVKGLDDMLDSGELSEINRWPAARALEAALDNGAIVLDPNERAWVDAAIRELEAPSE
jgi:hypothetical protein